MVRSFEQNQPIALEPVEPGDAPDALRAEPRTPPRAPGRSRYGRRAMLFAAIASLFWIGVWCAYLWGYFGPRGLKALEIQQYALFGAAILLPPLLFVAIAGAFALAHRMGGTLAERFVRAKTGTLANVSALSGFAGSPGHPPLVFSIIIGDIATPQDARRAQDRIAELLVSFVEAESNPALPK